MNRAAMTLLLSSWVAACVHMPAGEGTFSVVSQRLYRDGEVER